MVQNDLGPLQFFFNTMLIAIFSAGLLEKEDFFGGSTLSSVLNLTKSFLDWVLTVKKKIGGQQLPTILQTEINLNLRNNIYFNMGQIQY